MSLFNLNRFNKPDNKIDSNKNIENGGATEMEDKKEDINVDDFVSLDASFNGTKHGDTGFINEEQANFKEDIVETEYNKLIDAGFVNNDGQILNKICDQELFDTFFDSQNDQERSNLVISVAEKYLDQESLDYINRYSRDKKNEKFYYLPNLIKNTINSLQRAVAIAAYKQEESVEESNTEQKKINIEEAQDKIETLKSIYIKYFKKEKFKNTENSGFDKEKDFLEKMKAKFEKPQFENKIYILKASEYDDIANGIDFIIYYKGVDENGELRDTPIACVDLGTAIYKHSSYKDFRIRTISDYIYHDYSKNEYRKWFRKNTPIFNVDSEHKNGWYSKFVDSFKQQLPEFKNNPKIKRDYIWRLEEVLKFLEKNIRNKEN